MQTQQSSWGHQTSSAPQPPFDWLMDPAKKAEIEMNWFLWQMSQVNLNNQWQPIIAAPVQALPQAPANANN